MADSTTTISDVANLRGGKRRRLSQPKGSAMEYEALKKLVFDWIKGIEDLEDFEKQEFRQFAKTVKDLEDQQFREEQERERERETAREEASETVEEEKEVESVPDEPLFSPNEDCGAQSNSSQSSYSVSFESGASDSFRSSCSSFEVKGKKCLLILHLFF